MTELSINSDGIWDYAIYEHNVHDVNSLFGKLIIYIAILVLTRLGGIIKSRTDISINRILHRHLWFPELLFTYRCPVRGIIKSRPDISTNCRLYRHVSLCGLLFTYKTEKYSYHFRPLVAHSASLQSQIKLHLNRESPTWPLCYALNREWSFDIQIQFTYYIMFADLVMGSWSFTYQHAPYFDVLTAFTWAHCHYDRFWLCFPLLKIWRQIVYGASKMTASSVTSYPMVCWKTWFSTILTRSKQKLICRRSLRCIKTNAVIMCDV